MNKNQQPKLATHTIAIAGRITGVILTFSIPLSWTSHLHGSGEGQDYWVLARASLSHTVKQAVGTKITTLCFSFSTLPELEYTTFYIQSQRLWDCFMFVV